MKKALQRIVTSERLSISDEMLEEICINSNGDLRSAINSIQCYYLGAERSSTTSSVPAKKKKGAKKKSEETSSSNVNKQDLSKYEMVHSACLNVT
jgi:DNA polymerase III delta prime subunit